MTGSQKRNGRLRAKRKATRFVPKQATKAYDILMARVNAKASAASVNA